MNDKRLFEPFWVNNCVSCEVIHRCFAHRGKGNHKGGGVKTPWRTFQNFFVVLRKRGVIMLVESVEVFDFF